MNESLISHRYLVFLRCCAVVLALRFLWRCCNPDPYGLPHDITKLEGLVWLWWLFHGQILWAVEEYIRLLQLRAASEDSTEHNLS